ncbi:C39 family peptidase [Sorangium sp. So ce185]|uniref:C39 family peptidase n=1 Tax=Sorangium sp. So ce185 TaxID=3133287 RepID=UPI003F61AC84
MDTRLSISMVALAGLAAPVALAACSAPGTETPEAGLDHTASAAQALIADVPYLRQLDYAGIGESACGPTSLAMILRYYYPTSFIDVPEIYHAGFQSYGYKGPAVGYRNISWGAGVTADPGDTAIPAGYKDYYKRRGYSGALREAMVRYLNHVWGMQTTDLYSEDALYSALAAGPVIGHVYANGDSAAGHYLVILGIEDQGTPSRDDDAVIVNDPYDGWAGIAEGGQGKAISHHDFFVRGRDGSRWFRDAIQLFPNEPAEQRAYTVLVDTGNNPTSGNAARNVFQVDDVNDAIDGTSDLVWWTYYGPMGNWYYPNEANRAARWTPRLEAGGMFEVSTKFVGDPESGTVTYRVYNASGAEIATETVDQHRSSMETGWAVIASSVELTNGAYVRATDISPGTNVDAIKFKYLGPSSGGGTFASWRCPMSFYGTRDGCDCNCGAPDPDCSWPDEQLYGCDRGQSCSAAGVCVP